MGRWTQKIETVVACSDGVFVIAVDDTLWYGVPGPMGESWRWRQLPELPVSPVSRLSKDD